MNWTESTSPPPFGQIVIVAMPGRKGALLGKYMGEGQWRVAYGSRISANVTHWMPRPELPYPYKRTQKSWYETGRKNGLVNDRDRGADSGGVGVGSGRVYSRGDER